MKIADLLSFDTPSSQSPAATPSGPGSATKPTALIPKSPPLQIPSAQPSLTGSTNNGSSTTTNITLVHIPPQHHPTCWEGDQTTSYNHPSRPAPLILNGLEIAGREQPGREQESLLSPGLNSPRRGAISCQSPLEFIHLRAYENEDKKLLAYK